MRQPQRLTSSDVASGTDAIVRAVNKNLDFFSREEIVFSSVSIAGGGSSSFAITLGKTVRLISVKSDRMGTLQLYGTASDRDTNSRIQSSVALSAASPALGGTVSNLDDPVSTAIYAKLTNTGSTGVFHLTFTVLQLEV